jgi:hypothetical protein
LNHEIVLETCLTTFSRDIIGPIGARQPISNTCAWRTPRSWFGFDAFAKNESRFCQSRKAKP